MAARRPSTPCLTKEYLETEKRRVRNQTKTDLVSSDIRNVLFCGATRSGKTNCFKVMQDPCYCPDNQSIFSETRDTKFRSFSLKDSGKNAVHNVILTLIDSSGMFEERSTEADFKTRTNEKVGELIIDCLKHEVTYLNLVVLFLPIGVRIDRNDVDAIDLFVSMFQNPNADERTNNQLDVEINEIKASILGASIKGAEPDLNDENRVKIQTLEDKKRLPMALCLTRADGVNEDSRVGFVEQLQNHPKLKPYFDSNSLFLLLMGCADHRFKTFGSESHYSDVLKDLFTGVKISSKRSLCQNIVST